MIINSLLENDLYSFTQQQAILHQFPDVEVEYKFKCRNDVDLLPYLDEIEDEIDHLCTLTFSQEELRYLSSIPFFKPSYIEFLREFKLNRKRVCVYTSKRTALKSKLGITIKGSWFHTVLFEVPILAIVSEICLKAEGVLQIGYERLQEKIQLVKENGQWIKTGMPNFKFSDFGLRRRYSSEWHDHVVKTLVEELPDNFVGTSNVYLAQKYSTKTIGTMSHQWICAGQGLPNVRISESQKYMLEAWVKEYRGDLGIALSDTLGFDAFLRDFDLYFSKIFDGCRHDSGDPVAWGEKLIAHYEKLGIDPETKTAVFSDGLTFPLALDICKWFHGRIKKSFGIGTNLTNDVGTTPLQNVIKMVRVNGNPVAKISDSPGKGMCEDNDYLTYLKTVFKIESFDSELLLRAYPYPLNSSLLSKTNDRGYL